MDKFMINLTKERKIFLRQGMTLIEIMIVVTLVVAIAGIIGWNVIGASDKASIGLAETQLKSFKGNIEAYRLYYKKYPEKLQDLVNTPDGKSIIEELPQDPWGNDYVYEKSGNRIKIYSIGADNTPNNDDDVVINMNN